LIYYESGTISPRGRAQPWSGSTHGKGPSFIIQQGELPILFLDSRSTLLECFGGYWGQGGRGSKSSIELQHRARAQLSQIEGLIHQWGRDLSLSFIFGSHVAFGGLYHLFLGYCHCVMSSQLYCSRSVDLLYQDLLLL
jgi:hypothetical protein